MWCGCSNRLCLYIFYIPILIVVIIQNLILIKLVLFLLKIKYYINANSFYMQARLKYIPILTTIIWSFNLVIRILNIDEEYIPPIYH